MNLAHTTWEQRRSMSADELRRAMGSLHVLHADYRPRTGPAVLMPNLAGRQPCIEVHDSTFSGQWRQLLRGVMA